MHVYGSLRGGMNTMRQEPKSKRAPAGRATGPKRVSESRIIAALDRNAGVIALAARELELDRAGLWRRIDRSDSLTAALRSIEETVLDAAEGVVKQAIVRDHDVRTARWLLALKGRDRGYRAREDNPALTDEELRSIVTAVAAEGVDALKRLRDWVAIAA
jgi:hypothetical protein